MSKNINNSPLSLESLQLVSSSSRGGGGGILKQQSSGRYRLYLNQTAIQLLNKEHQELYFKNKTALEKKHLYGTILKDENKVYIAVANNPSWSGKSLQYLSSTLYLNADSNAVKTLLQYLDKHGKDDFTSIERVDCKDESVSLLRLV